ncbi:hypothetical protein NMG60_11000920 [Bertholletia excelsa]
MRSILGRPWQEKKKTACWVFHGRGRSGCRLSRVVHGKGRGKKEVACGGGSSMAGEERGANWAGSSMGKRRGERGVGWAGSSMAGEETGEERGRRRCWVIHEKGRGEESNIHRRGREGKKVPSATLDRPWQAKRRARKRKKGARLGWVVHGKRREWGRKRAPAGLSRPWDRKRGGRKWRQRCWVIHGKGREGEERGTNWARSSMGRGGKKVTSMEGEERGKKVVLAMLGCPWQGKKKGSKGRHLGEVVHGKGKRGRKECQCCWVIHGKGRVGEERGTYVGSADRSTVVC